MSSDITELLETKKKVADILLGNTGNTVGVGVNQTEDTIRVYLRQKNETGKRHVMSLLNGSKADGHEIEYVHAGHVQALQQSQCYYSRTVYHRPVCGGDSIGHYAITSGSIASVVYDAVNTSRRYILTNNHVGAASSTYQSIKARTGDKVYAPGCFDTSGCVYQIGTLYKFVPFDEYNYNYVDCSLILPDSDNDILDKINGIGNVMYHTDPTENMYVTKSGRTSWVTSDTVFDTHAAMEVDYGGKIIKFDNCLVTNNMAQPGDSGSLLVSSIDKKAVGLLFAGSDQITIHNNINYVLSALNVIMSPDDTPVNVYIPQQQYIPSVKLSDIYAGIITITPVAVGLLGLTAISGFVRD